MPSNGSAADEDDSDTEDVLRETSLALLALTFSQAQQQLESLKQELELIGNMPPPPQSREDSRTEKAREQDNDMWKLDAPRPSGGSDGKGPLMDTAGRVRRLNRKFTTSLIQLSLYVHSPYFLLGLRIGLGYKRRSSSLIIGYPR